MSFPQKSLCPFESKCVELLYFMVTSFKKCHLTKCCRAFPNKIKLTKDILLSQELRCPFEHKCEVTQVTRRFCQRCRLKKCLSVGMKKESILSPEEKLVKRQKIEENRQKKQQMGQAPTPGPADATAAKRSLSPPAQLPQPPPAAAQLSADVGKRLRVHSPTNEVLVAFPRKKR